MVDVRPATHDDVIRIAKMPLPRTGRTLAIEAKGSLIAVTGYYFDHGRVIIYAMIDEAAKTLCDWYAFDIVRCGKMIVAEAEKLGMPIFAGADPSIPGSDKLLKHLGFQHHEREVWSWPGHH